MAGSSTRLMHEIIALRQRRYPDLLVIHSPRARLSPSVAVQVAAASGLAFVDFRESVLKPCESVVPGAYNRTQLRDWLKIQAIETGGLFVVNADEVIAPWDPSERLAFFREFLHIECREPAGARAALPIVLLTEHRDAEALEQSGLGQGTVIALLGD